MAELGNRSTLSCQGVQSGTRRILEFRKLPRSFTHLLGCNSNINDLFNSFWKVSLPTDTPGGTFDWRDSWEAQAKRKRPLASRERPRCRLVYMGHSRARQPVCLTYTAKLMLSVGFLTVQRQTC
jgi:hypothetical protein